MGSCDSDQMVTYEIEAAEALAGLACNAAVHNGGGALGSSAEAAGRRSSLLQGKATEADKEVRRWRRILANRESARKTIRRRQAMYADLIRKATQLSMENENLEKKREMVVEEYAHLKNTNEYLKAKVAEIEAGALGKKEESKKSVNGISISTPPIFPYEYPSIVPFLWPAIVMPPPNNAFEIQGFSRDDMFPLFFQNQEHALRSNKQGTSLYVPPLPCFFPFHAQSTTPHPLVPRGGCSYPSSSLTVSHSHHLTLSQKTKPEAPNLKKAIPRNNKTATKSGYSASITSRQSRNSLICDTIGVKAIPSSASSSSTLNLSSAKNQKSALLLSKSSENADAAAEARRKRKELMRLSNAHFHQKGNRGKQ